MEMNKCLTFPVVGIWGGKDVMTVIVFQDKCPTVPLQLFLELFLFKQARYSVQENDRNLLINSRT
jgi:hypothetical protein